MLGFLQSRKISKKIYATIVPKLYNFLSTVAECTASDFWIRPISWSGPNPVVYRSFDNIECILKMERTQLADFNYIPGKV